MGLRAHVGQLRALIEEVDATITRLVSESWLTRGEIEHGLRHWENTSLTEAGFFDAIRRIAKTHGKPDTRKPGACPKGQKMVFGVCRELGAEDEKPPKDFFAAARQIAQHGPAALDRSRTKKPTRKPRKGEDDSHMPPAWHRKQAAEFAQRAAFHRDQAKQVWAGDPRSAAHHLLRSIEFDVRRQHHDQAAEMSPGERQRAVQANEPPRPGV